MCNCRNSKGKMNRVFLGLGSNIGNKKENLLTAIDILQNGGSIEKESSIYDTKPVGYADQDNFLNMVVEFNTEMNANDLLIFLQGIEERLGKKIEFKNGPRTIDIDILFFNNELIEEEVLTIPHKDIEERAFVLIPLNEIAPELIHPKLNKTINELTNNMEDKDVRKY